MDCALLLSCLAILVVMSVPEVTCHRCSKNHPPCMINKFYYHQSSNKCRRINSQGGSCSLRLPIVSENENAFNTLGECRTRCVIGAGLTATTAVPTTATTAPSIPDLCMLPWASGPGFQFKLRYYYDHKRKECTSKQYSGPENHGNQNRFMTEEDCINTCINPQSSPPTNPLSVTTPSEAASSDTPPTAPPTTDTPSTAPPTTDTPSTDAPTELPTTNDQPSGYTDLVRLPHPIQRISPLLIAAISFGMLVVLFGVLSAAVLSILWIMQKRRLARAKNTKKKKKPKQITPVGFIPRPHLPVHAQSTSKTYYNPHLPTLTISSSVPTAI